MTLLIPKRLKMTLLIPKRLKMTLLISKRLKMTLLISKCLKMTFLISNMFRVFPQDHFFVSYSSPSGAQGCFRVRPTDSRTGSSKKKERRRLAFPWNGIERPLHYICGHLKSTAHTLAKHPLRKRSVSPSNFGKGVREEGCWYAVDPFFSGKGLC